MALYLSNKEIFSFRRISFNFLTSVISAGGAGSTDIKRLFCKFVELLFDFSHCNLHNANSHVSATSSTQSLLYSSNIGITVGFPIAPKASPIGKKYIIYIGINFNNKKQIYIIPAS